jgi:hypothetical protein
MHHHMLFFGFIMLTKFHLCASLCKISSDGAEGDGKEDRKELRSGARLQREVRERSRRLRNININTYALQCMLMIEIVI